MANNGPIENRRKPMEEVKAEGYQVDGKLFNGRIGDLVLVGDGPRSRHEDDHIVREGYAVHLGEWWWFFSYLEPALAFGRAGRASLEVHSYGVGRAVFEIRHIAGARQQKVLWVSSEGLDREPDERARLMAWVEGIKAGSAGWSPPDQG
jgi:hypothetical protein